MPPPYANSSDAVRSQKPVQKIVPFNDPAEIHRLIHHAVIEIMHVAARAPKNNPRSIIAAAKRLTNDLFRSAVSTPAKHP